MMKKTSQDKPNKPVVRRGDVWMVEEQDNFDGSLYKKNRPWVICQSPIGIHSPILVAAPISSTQKSRQHNFLQNVSVYTASQVHYESITTIMRDSLIRHVYTLNKEEIEEMDMRLCVPLDLSKSSVLHIEKVDIKSRQKKGNTKVFMGEVRLKFYTERIRFTNYDFVEYFGKSSSSLLDDDLTFISSFLESLNGLKFCYKLMMK